MRSVLIASCLMCTALAVGSASVLADTAETDVVKKREQLMKYNGESMKKMTPMFKGEAPYDAEVVKREAKNIGDFAGVKITELYPEGSLHGDTEALPVIWERWSEFVQLAEDLGSYSYALADAADNPESAVASGSGLGLGAGTSLPTPEELAKGPPQAAFVAVGKVCGACHETFREKKKE